MLNEYSSQNLNWYYNMFETIAYFSGLTRATMAAMFYICLLVGILGKFSLLFLLSIQNNLISSLTNCVSFKVLKMLGFAPISGWDSDKSLMRQIGTFQSRCQYILCRSELGAKSYITGVCLARISTRDVRFGTQIGSDWRPQLGEIWIF